MTKKQTRLNNRSEWLRKKYLKKYFAKQKQKKDFTLLLRNVK